MKEQKKKKEKEKETTRAVAGATRGRTVM